MGQDYPSVLLYMMHSNNNNNNNEVMSYELSFQDGGRGAGVLGVACSYFRDCPLPHIAHDGDNGEVLFRYLECQRDLN